MSRIGTGTVWLMRSSRIRHRSQRASACSEPRPDVASGKLGEQHPSAPPLSPTVGPVPSASPSPSGPSAERLRGSLPFGDLVVEVSPVRIESAPRVAGDQGDDGKSERGSGKGGTGARSPFLRRADRDSIGGRRGFPHETLSWFTPQVWGQPMIDLM